MNFAFFWSLLPKLCVVNLYKKGLGALSRTKNTQKKSLRPLGGPRPPSWPKEPFRRPFSSASIHRMHVILSAHALALGFGNAFEVKPLSSTPLLRIRQLDAARFQTTGTASFITQRSSLSELENNKTLMKLILLKTTASAPCSAAIFCFYL